MWQDPVLFSCSIAENIAYGAIDPASVGFKEIEEAARKANAYDFISSFSSRFDTVVGERGVLLSGRWLWLDGCQSGCSNRLLSW